MIKERQAYEWEVIADFLAERCAILERDNLTLNLRAEFAENEAENYKARLDAAGLLEEGE